MVVCNSTSLVSLGDTCVRELWAGVVPFAFVGIVLVSTTPPARFLLRTITKPFTNFLTIREAEALISGNENISEEDRENAVPLWRTLVLSTVSLVESLFWIGFGCYNLILHSEDVWGGIRDFLVAITWFYAALRLIIKPTATVPHDLLVLIGTHLVFGIIIFFGHLYDSYAYALPPPNAFRLTAEIVNLLAVTGMYFVILNMPLDIPSKQVEKNNIGTSVSPEDYTTVWGWMSFRWLMPLLELGANTTLKEKDVWSLSPTMQSRPLHIKFSRSTGRLLKRLWSTNSRDLILGFVLTYVSIVFNYAGPFFLKRILDSLADDGRSPEKRALAFVYAFLAFFSTLCKAQADLQQLWYGRRACTRIRSELMASIYDKALKRKDFSGVVDKDAAKSAKAPAAKVDAKADEPKAGADIGKIVNLMAGDASRVSITAATMYFIYGAPFEIVIASVFLYQLLGLSAFTGFFVLLLSWPLNNFVAKRAVRIQKGISTARDKRMGVLNELISAVKFIKFFAWEDRWIGKVMNAREVEMQWMIKSRINSVCFTLIWTCASILVSVSAFFAYVAQGNELTIGTAFTAIALFQMVRAPLNVIPSWVVSILQAKVALDRIATYLDEEEVDEQVSTLKKGRVPPSEESDTGLGIIHGTFRWNEVGEKRKEDGTAGNEPSKKAKTSNSADDLHSSPTTDPPEVASTMDDTASTIADSTGDRRFELKDISVMFPEGQLTVVTGPTASGKTALLMALLGELTTLEGKIIMSKNASKVDEHGLAYTISYAAQSPWLRHQSIKDNILFGNPLDEERYAAVLECCALKPDLDILEDGDATEIGVRGVSLSGGQKARVALARAVYARSKYVLLDDPLSAVDSHTARFLYERLFRGPLLADRTVILVTHHVELVLPGAHYLVRMLDGRIDTQGTVEDLRNLGVLDMIVHVEEAEAQKDEQLAAAVGEADSHADIDVEAVVEHAQPTKDRAKVRKLVEEEHRETGNVKWHIYSTYLKASSYWTWGILFSLIILVQVLGVGEKFWIKIWGEAYSDNQDIPAHLSIYSQYAEHQQVLEDGLSHLHHTAILHNPSAGFNVTQVNFPPAQEHPYFYVGIYAAIALLGGFMNIASAMTQYTGALRASRILFGRLLRTVVRATMRWHDVTPQGRILNRFSKDIETVDTSLASSLQSVNQSLTLFAVSIFTVVVVFPLFIFPALILGFFYRRVAIAYLNTGRDVRRMESNTRSPIFANFSELLDGIVTVRAFGVEQRFLDDVYTKIDLTTKMWYTFWMTNRWLLLTFDTLGATGILATTLFALLGYVDAGLAGVCITSAISFMNSVYWTCRFWTTLELNLNSVERVVEYLDLPQEPPAVIESNRPPAYWPSSTSANKDSLLVVNDLTVKYAPDLPAVVRGVSFSLRAKERVGLLGRTGSGKSTLAMSLLRFVDPASGHVIIDGIDIKTIGLHDLRSRITFIPQDATLFSGTLRDNLDPFDEHSDAECLDVLHRVHMLSDGQHISNEASRAASVLEPEGSEPASTIVSVSTSTPTEIESKTVITLDSQVSPGGTNFSQGQRQLIAMARALLRRSAIIILDEATSSIDFATDAKIQATIREEFGGSLLLTVAHRLRTIIDYDRLIVLDKGEVAEFDTPLNLIRKDDGIFRSMCLKSGTFAELEAAAKAKTGP